ncbi:MAG: Rab family GTPase [Methanobacteriota archaeon]
MHKELVKTKILLLGDGGVGKTSLIRRFVLDQYSDEYIMTIGAKVSKKGLTLGRPPFEVDMVMQIWDVFGQRGYGGVHEIAVEGAHGVLLVYDITREDTRRSTEEYWMPMVWRLAGRIPMVLVGNKFDLAEDRIRAREYLYYLTQKHTAAGVLTSAKTGENVEDAFRILADKALEASRLPTKRVALVTPPQEPVERLVRVADKLMTDFCYRLGGVETGMPIAKRQLERAGVDIRAPTEETLRAFVDRLSAVESDFLSPEDIESNRARRLGWLEGKDWP